MSQKRRLPQIRFPQWAALISAMLVSLPAVADLYMKQKENNSMLGQSVVRTIWVGEEAVRMDDPNQSVIVRIREKEILMLMHAQKQVMKTPIGAAGALMQGLMGDVSVKVTPTDETKTIGRWSARKYRQTMNTAMGRTESEVWTTEDIRLKDVELLKRFSSALFLSQSGGGGASMAKLEAELSKIQGVPVLTKSSASMMGMTTTTTTELLEIEEKPAPAGIYQPPADYKSTSLLGAAGTVSAAGAKPEPAEVAPPVAAVPTTVPARADAPAVKPVSAPVSSVSINPAVPLERTSSKQVGASILLPAGAITRLEMPANHAWEYLLPDGMNSYLVQITTDSPASDMKSAIRVATMTGQRKIAAAKRVDNGIAVVKQRRGVMQEVWMFRDNSSGALAAKCRGPAKDLRTLLYICASVRKEG